MNWDRAVPDYEVQVWALAKVSLQLGKALYSHGESFLRPGEYYKWVGLSLIMWGNSVIN